MCSHTVRGPYVVRARAFVQERPPFSAGKHFGIPTRRTGLASFHGLPGPQTKTE